MRCVVVGAGIVGLAVARELRARGIQVSWSTARASAPGPPVQPGGVRQQWGTRVACRLAVESVAFWRDAEVISRSRPAVTSYGGCRFTAHSRATLDRLDANVRLQGDERPVAARLTGRAAELVRGCVSRRWRRSVVPEDWVFDRPQRSWKAFARDADVGIDCGRSTGRQQTGASGTSTQTQ